MKYLVALLLTIFLAFALSLYLPWYAIAIASFLTAMVVGQNPGKSFSSGFVGIFILWSVLSLWINMNNEHLLSNKMASLLPLQGEGYLLLIVGAIVGGIVGGLAALSGAYCRKLF